MLHRPGQLWDPWRDLSRFRDEMERVLGNLPAEVDFPPVNVTRLPDRLVVEAFAPGVDRSTLDVTTAGNTLTIRGERRAENGEKPEAYHRRERDAGRFVRTISLDERVSTTDVTATYRDGILHIELPYAPEARPRKIAIAN
jgi:HSP20 family protein